MIDLDFKPLIVDAYQNGQQELLYVVPFVAKVLESCAKSKVFKPPCPWTMGIMNLLAELHREHDLKLNLKFEIEVLCKTLAIELHSLHPGDLLKDYDKLNQMLNVRSFGEMPGPSTSNSMAHSSRPSNSSSVQAMHTPQVSMSSQGQNLASQNRGMMSNTGPMDPNLTMMMMSGSHGPGSAGAGMGKLKKTVIFGALNSKKPLF